MALIAAYGMDVYNDYSSEFVAQQEWVNDGGSFGGVNSAINTTGGRFGGGALVMHPSAIRSDEAALLLPANFKTLFFFCAFRVTEIGHDTEIIEFSADGVNHTEFQLESATDSLQITRGGTGTIVYDEPIAENVWHTIEMKLLVDGAAGELRVLLDDVEILDLTGVDTANGANEYVNKILFVSDSISSGDQIEVRFDDVVLWDETGTGPMSTTGAQDGFQGDMRIHTLRPNAPGDVTGFTPSAGANWEAVNDSPGPNDDTDYVEITGTGVQDLYNVEDLGPTGDILGAVVKVFDRKLDAGARSIRLLTKSGGITGTGSSLPVLTTWTYQQEIFEFNPDSGDPWTAIEINAVQIGMENV